MHHIFGAVVVDVNASGAEPIGVNFAVVTNWVVLSRVNVGWRQIDKIACENRSGVRVFVLRSWDVKIPINLGSRLGKAGRVGVFLVRATGLLKASTGVN